jgi:hypothetical protein
MESLEETSGMTVCVEESQQGVDTGTGDVEDTGMDDVEGSGTDDVEGSGTDDVEEIRTAADESRTTGGNGTETLGTSGAGAVMDVTDTVSALLFGRLDTNFRLPGSMKFLLVLIWCGHCCNCCSRERPIR